MTPIEARDFILMAFKFVRDQGIEFSLCGNEDGSGSIYFDDRNVWHREWIETVDLY